jgi:hypothetical protein
MGQENKTLASKERRQAAQADSGGQALHLAHHVFTKNQ